VDRYLEDLTAATEQVRRGEVTSQPREARYS
jgi:hypothetical protein